MIGHRGASAHALENTLEAFRRARADGADGVELDVMLSGDGEVVVFHDENLARLGGRRDHVAALPIAALREIELFSPAGLRGRIPTLDEVLEELGPLLVNVELKVERAALAWWLVPRVCEVLARHGLGERVIVSSFHPFALALIAREAPAVARALLFHREQAVWLRRAWPRVVVRPAALHPDHWLVDERTARRWHAAGYAVNTWTVDDPRELVWLAELGVDGVITNDPARAREALGIS